MNMKQTKSKKDGGPRVPAGPWGLGARGLGPAPSFAYSNQENMVSYSKDCLPKGLPTDRPTRSVPTRPTRSVPSRLKHFSKKSRMRFF